MTDAQTGQAPQPDPHKANPTRVVNVGPMTSDQFYPSGALTLSGRAHDPENGMIDFYWTWPERMPVHERVPSDATVSEAFVPNPPRIKTYVAYLTAYDATSLFDQCQWNIVVGTNSAPNITVIADDLVIDFGRLDIWRRLFAPQPAVDALPISGSALAPSIDPPDLIATRPFGDLCAYVGATPPQAQQTYLSTLPLGDQKDPSQYPGGMTCVYAIVGDVNGDFLRAGFRIPDMVMGRGTLYAAIPVPKATEGGAHIVLVDDAPRNAPKTVADILPGGLVSGSILDTDNKIAAYNATLSYLASLGWLPVTGPLLTYTPILPLPIWPRGVGGGPQALPVIWEAPDDPDPGRQETHDCVRHRFELTYDPLCTIPAAGTVNIEGWVADSHNPIQSGFTTVAFPDWMLEMPATPIVISPNGTIYTHTPTYTWNVVSNATHYQLAVSDASGSWVINDTYAASAAACAAGTGTCSVASTANLASGNATWFVAAWNPAGWSPWSAGKNFTVADPPSGTYEPTWNGQPCPQIRERVIAQCKQMGDACASQNCKPVNYSGCAMDCPGCGGTFPQEVEWCRLHPSYESKLDAGLSSFVSEIQACIDRFLADDKPGRVERGAECQRTEQKEFQGSWQTWVQQACQARCAEEGRQGVAVLGGGRHRCECR